MTDGLHLLGRLRTLKQKQKALEWDESPNANAFTQ